MIMISSEKLLKQLAVEDENNHQLFFALGSSYDELNDFEKSRKCILRSY